MAKNKIINYIDYPLDTIFEIFDDEGLSLKVIHTETGIPVWQLKELEELGYINNGQVTHEGKLILKIMMYCMNNRRFIKSSIGRISYRDRAAMLNNIKTGHTKLIKWIYSRVYNLKNDGHKVIIKDIYNELCQHFPVLEEQGYQGFKDVQKYINSASRKYRRTVRKETDKV